MMGQQKSEAQLFNYAVNLEKREEGKEGPSLLSTHGTRRCRAEITPR
jgi:hypothetical protein